MVKPREDPTLHDVAVCPARSSLQWLLSRCQGTWYQPAMEEPFSFMAAGAAAAALGGAA